MLRPNDMMQRRLIMDALKARDDHPTAEQIFLAINTYAGNISCADVRRNLQALLARGAVACITQAKLERYDHDTAPHHHVLCTRCGAVSNAPVDYYQELDDDVSKATDYHIDRHHMLFEGVCPECRKWGVSQRLCVERPAAEQR